ncbi:hypothetical protein GCE9029_01367 [Grimontia celer]|uniref:Uncharacterized protein n=1 Tax=Grimontia celer TaxID=1796497 RepID=A0A128EZ07_9GAMM|nr:hypothetical protein [Grimontia celer]CZF79271.1 hypothetical protein GCE9029_01367 [Grimontia celer]
MYVDYSKYSPKSLIEALSTIDGDAYPENYKSLIAEISSRREEIEMYEASLEQKKAERWESYFSFIGYCQLATGVLAIVGCVLSVYNQLLLDAAFGFGIAALNIAAGYSIVKRECKYFFLSYLNLGLQVCSFGIGGFYFNYYGLGGVFLTYDWVLPVYNFLEFGFSIGGNIASFSMGSDSNGFIQLDVLAILCLLIIYKVMTKRNINPRL